MCVSLYAVRPTDLMMRIHDIASGPMMNGTGYGVLQTGLTVLGTCSNYAYANMLHRRRGGTS